MIANNVILTGVARSGTTLMCYLLNKLPQVVALHEPLRFKKLVKLGTPEAIVTAIEKFFASTRDSILNHGVAISKNLNGRVPDNPFGQRATRDGIRVDQQPKGGIKIQKDLVDDFLLCLKHPAPFTALLPWLTARFRCYAIIRNPISILASWNSVEIPEREGHAPPAVEKLLPDLRAALAQREDKIERQLYLLSWYFEQYRKYLHEEAILRYEEIIASHGTCLDVITPEARLLNEPLQSKNKNTLYDQGLMRKISERLLQTDGAYWQFYAKDSVTELLVA